MPRYMLLTNYDDTIGAGPMSEWDPTTSPPTWSTCGR